MPRSNKGSEDELEVKSGIGVGRRTRVTGGPSVDSPLRRSTRNRNNVVVLDETSSESVAIDPPARSTRRKTLATETVSENVRSLRPRGNSNASDMSETVENESQKRVTRRSIVATTVETPTKSRLRRNTRAGSESKTMSPSVRTTRRTRASSVDMDINQETSNDSMLLNNTPIKTRAKASVVPSEPAVIEESENLQHNTSVKSKSILESSDISSEFISAEKESSNSSQPLPLKRISMGLSRESSFDSNVEEPSPVFEPHIVIDRKDIDAAESAHDILKNGKRRSSVTTEKRRSSLKSFRLSPDLSKSDIMDSPKDLPNDIKEKVKRRSSLVQSPLSPDKSISEMSHVTEESSRDATENKRRSSQATVKLFAEESNSEIYDLTQETENDQATNTRRVSLKNLTVPIDKLATEILYEESSKDTKRRSSLKQISLPSNESLSETANIAEAKKTSSRRTSLKNISPEITTAEVVQMIGLPDDLKFSKRRSSLKHIPSPSEESAPEILTGSQEMNNSNRRSPLKNFPIEPKTANIPDISEDLSSDTKSSKRRSSQKHVPLLSEESLSETSTVSHDSSRRSLAKNTLMSTEQTEILQISVDVADDSQLSKRRSTLKRISSKSEESFVEILPSSPKKKINDRQSLKNSASSPEKAAIEIFDLSEDLSNDSIIHRQPTLPLISSTSDATSLKTLNVSKDIKNSSRRSSIKSSNSSPEKENTELLNVSSKSSNESKRRSSLKKLTSAEESIMEISKYLEESDKQPLPEKSMPEILNDSRETAESVKDTKQQSSVDLSPKSPEETITDILDDIEELSNHKENRTRRSSLKLSDEGKLDELSSTNTFQNENDEAENQSSSAHDKSSTLGEESSHENEEDYNLVLTEKSASEKDLEQPQAASDYDSDDTIIMQSPAPSKPLERAESTDTIDIEEGGDTSISHESKTPPNTSLSSENQLLSSPAKILLENQNDSLLKENSPQKGSPLKKSEVSDIETRLDNDEKESKSPTKNRKSLNSDLLVSERQESCEVSNEDIETNNDDDKIDEKEPASPVKASAKNTPSKTRLSSDDNKSSSSDTEVARDTKAPETDGETNKKSDSVMPTFLRIIAGVDSDSSDNEDSASMDSDLAREYNFKGESNHEYSDDNIAGDECRVSESEESDPDDDGDDMKDFIDDEEEESDENEDNDADEDEDLEIQEIDSENEEKDKDESADQDVSEVLDESDMKLKKKKKSPMQLNFESSDEDEEAITSEKTNDEQIAVESNESPQSNNENDNIAPVDSFSTPKVRNDSRSEQKKSTGKKRSSPSKSLKTSSLNNTMFTPEINTPDTKLLMKEKLNDTLPALKLQSPKVVKVDTLESMSEETESHVEKPKKKKNKKKKGVDESLSEITEIEETELPLNIEVDQPVSTKKNKKKKMAQSAEVNEIEESPVAIVEKQSGKNKKKKMAQGAEVNEIEGSPVAIVEKQSGKKKKNKKLAESITPPITRTPEKPTSEKKESQPKAGNKRVRVPAEESASEVLSISPPKKVRQKEAKKTKASKSIPPPEIASMSPMMKSNIKRLSEDVLETLSDVSRPKKRRKLDAANVPSKTMFDSKHQKPENLTIDEAGYIPLSGSGGTTQFSVVNLKKFSAKRSKKVSAAAAFRQRILARNPRQPVSAYLIYQQKRKAAGDRQY